MLKDAPAAAFPYLQAAAGLAFLTRRDPDATLLAGGSRKGSKGNAVRVLQHAMPRLPPQL